MLHAINRCWAYSSGVVYLFRVIRILSLIQQHKKVKKKVYILFQNKEK